MNEIKIKEFKNKYAGRACFLVGSGPTKFDYKELSNTQDIIFFINDTINFEKYTNNESFFFTHHPDTFFNQVHKSIFFCPTHYIRRHLSTNERFDNKNDDYEYKVKSTTAKNVVFHKIFSNCSYPDSLKNISFEQTGFPNWAFDKNQIIEKNALLAHNGSITTLIHFIWFAGFEQVKIIGCNPFFTPDHRYDKRISRINNISDSGFILKSIINNQKIMLNKFSIKHEYVDDYDYSIKML
jgi:hypothetical protein